MMRTHFRNVLLISPILIAIISSVTSCKNGTSDKAATDSTKTIKAIVPGDTMTLDPNKRYIYMTWDDSPQPPGTVICKKVFTEQDIKATFFAVGFNAFEPSRTRIIDSIRNKYPQFLLANHSFSHGFRDHYKDFYTHPDSAVADLLQVEKQFKIAVKIIRLPGSNSWVGKDMNKGPQSAKQVRDRLDAMGYNVIGWDIEWEQKPGTKFPKQSATELFNLVNKRFEQEYTTEPNAIVILSHDRLFGTPQYSDSLTAFIKMIKSDPRNVFETIDHYPLVMRK